MFRFLILIVNSLACFVAFSQNPKAIKYNDKIIDMQHRHIEKMAKFAGSISNTNPDKLNKAKDELEASLEKAYQQIEKMPDFEGDDALKNAALDWFKLSKKIIEDDFEILIPLLRKKEKDALDRVKIKETVERLIVEEDAIITNFEKAQQSFVERHGLDLVERPVKL
ncbi:MAG: hypothetical protein SFY32_10375 [Bacteroidota bacterium]|nr:hypothetical protein [Bacteroidota bacterium]